MAEELKKYPEAKLALGPGNLQQAHSCTHKTSKSKELKSTFGGNPSGITSGARSDELNFKVLIREEGVERDYWSAYENDETVQMRMKVPGKTLTITGEITDLETTGEQGNAVELTGTLKGVGEYADD